MAQAYWSPLLGTPIVERVRLDDGSALWLDNAGRLWRQERKGAKGLLVERGEWSRKGVLALVNGVLARDTTTFANAVKTHSSAGWGFGAGQKDVAERVVRLLAPAAR